jgi:APA family basic amino acid/polyamine antiporter
MASAESTTGLKRELGVADAVIVGAGSMIGAGVFAAWAPAADSAGTGLLIGLVVAGVIAFCNATSSAQLAAIHPESGGTYVYGRRQLNDTWGHLAGWGFVVGKTASCAAMALTVGAYLWPEQERLVAVLAVMAITAVNIGGLTRTVAVTRVLLVVSLMALTAVVIAGWTGGEASFDRLTPIDPPTKPAFYGILQSAGFMFFAFAGYARIATLGEEVKDPAVTIPKAVPRALGAVLVIYAIVGVTALVSVDASALAATDAPLQLVLGSDRSGVLAALEPVVRLGAGIAALGVLLNLIPGVSRTTLAMARQRDLPTWFSHIDAGRALPLRAEFTVAAIVILLVMTLDIRSSIAVSGVAVLTYYAVTNASALTLTNEQRRWAPILAWVGLAGCVILIASLPLPYVVSGVAVLLIGVVVRRLATVRT